MITKEKYLVYNKENQTLNLNAAEQALINNLWNSPRIKFKRLVKDYLDSSEDAEEAIERLDEIFSAYFTSAPDVPHPFVLRMDDLEELFKILEEYIDKKSNIKQSVSARNFKDLFKSSELYNYMLKELTKEEPERWFDESGNFIRSGRGNDNSGAVCDLLTLLIDFGYIKDDLIKGIRADKSKYALLCFDVIVGPKSSNLKGKGNQYDELRKRLKHMRYLKF